MKYRWLGLSVGALLIGLPHFVDFTPQSPSPRHLEGVAWGPPSAMGATNRIPHPRITPNGQEAIDRATAWLLRAIRTNGSVGPDIGVSTDLGCTAITGLALLSQGNTPTSGPQSKELRRILHYLLNVIEQEPQGAVPLENHTLLQQKIGKYASLFLVTLFMSQAYGECAQDDPAVQKALQRLVHAFARAQQADGTWGNESWAPVLGTVLGWECLRASSSAGIRIDASTERIGESLLKKVQEKNEIEAENWMFNFYKETASLRVLYSLGYQEDVNFREGVERVLRLPRTEPRIFTRAGGEEYLAFYLITECMIKQDEPSWGEWYPMVSEKLIENQNKDGSWSGHHCITSRTFCTAAAILTLQAPNQSLPSSDF